MLTRLIVFGLWTMALMAPKGGTGTEIDGAATRQTSHKSQDYHCKLSPDGTRERPITDAPEHDDHACVSPDGSRLIWSSNRDGQTDLYIGEIPAKRD
jgi:hypothetical protein